MTINKRKIFIFIPGIIIASFLSYEWLIILVSQHTAMFPHYIGLFLFLILIYFFRKDKSLKNGLLFTGIYLLLGVINFLSFTLYVTSSSFGIGLGSVEIWSPAINTYSLIILVLYCILNFDALTDIYLDYKEAKGKL